MQNRGSILQVQLNLFMHHLIHFKKFSSFTILSSMIFFLHDEAALFTSFSLIFGFVLSHEAAALSLLPSFFPFSRIPWQNFTFRGACMEGGSAAAPPSLPSRQAGKHADDELAALRGRAKHKH